MTLYTQQNLYLAIPCIICQCLHLLCYCCHRLLSTVLHHLNVTTISVHFTIENSQSTKLNCKKIITPLDVPATNHSNPSELAEVIVLGWQYPSTVEPQSCQGLRISMCEIFETTISSPHQHYCGRKNTLSNLTEPYIANIISSCLQRLL